MTIKTITAAVSACSLLVAALGGTAVAQSLEEQISGKTLVRGPLRLQLNADNTVGGQLGDGQLAGSWVIQDGQFCRTLTSPPRVAGAECQDIIVEGNTLTFIREDGTEVEYTME